MCVLSHEMKFELNTSIYNLDVCLCMGYFFALKQCLRGDKSKPCIHNDRL